MPGRPRSATLGGQGFRALEPGDASIAAPTDRHGRSRPCHPQVVDAARASPSRPQKPTSSPGSTRTRQRQPCRAPRSPHDAAGADPAIPRVRARAGAPGQMPDRRPKGGGRPPSPPAEHLGPDPQGWRGIEGATSSGALAWTCSPRRRWSARAADAGAGWSGAALQLGFGEGCGRCTQATHGRRDRDCMRTTWTASAISAARNSVQLAW